MKPEWDCRSTDEWYKNACNRLPYQETAAEYECPNFDPSAFSPKLKELSRMSREALVALAAGPQFGIRDAADQSTETLIEAMLAASQVDKLTRYLKRFRAYNQQLQRCVSGRQRHFGQCIEPDPDWDEDEGHRHWREQMLGVARDCSRKEQHWKAAHELALREHVERQEAILREEAPISPTMERVRLDSWRNPESRPRKPVPEKRRIRRVPMGRKEVIRRVAEAKARKEREEREAFEAVESEQRAQFEQARELLGLRIMQLRTWEDFYNLLPSLLRGEIPLGRIGAIRVLNRLDTDTGKKIAKTILELAKGHEGDRWAGIMHILLPLGSHLDPADRRKLSLLLLSGYANKAIRKNNWEWNWQLLTEIMNAGSRKWLKEAIEAMDRLQQMKMATGKNPEIAKIVKDIIDYLLNYVQAGVILLERSARSDADDLPESCHTLGVALELYDKIIRDANIDRPIQVAGKTYRIRWRKRGNKLAQSMEQYRKIWQKHCL